MKSCLIVGAGIGGLSAGVSLQRAGWDVTILERSANPRELGFGLLLAPNAIAALRQLGLAATMIKAGVTAKAVEIRELNGRVLRRFRTRPGGPYVVALRPELHGALLAAVGSEALCLSSEVVSFAQDAEQVTVTLADGTTRTASMLIAADGVGSVIRRQLHPDEPAPRASGYCAVRGVAHGAGRHLGELSAVGYLDDGMEVATARAGSDAIYWYMSLLSEDLRGEALSAPAIVQKRLPLFEPSLQAIVNATAPEDMRFDELFRRDPLASWGEGRVTLLGDAAHPVLPHTGQGAALAMEDAVVLGTYLFSTEIHRSGTGLGPVASPVPDRGESVENRYVPLREYERLRMRRTRRFIKLGPRIAGMTTTHSRFVRTLRSVALRLIPPYS